MLFKEVVIAVYSEDHIKTTNIYCELNANYFLLNKRYIYLPLSFKVLSVSTHGKQIKVFEESKQMYSVRISNTVKFS
jgi:hypothetical protein